MSSSSSSGPAAAGLKPAAAESHSAASQTIECALCRVDYPLRIEEAGEMNPAIRVLACSHFMCETDCRKLIEMKKSVQRSSDISRHRRERQEQSRLKCVECTQPHPLIDADTRSVDELLSSILTLSSFSRSIHRNPHLLPLLIQSSSASSSSSSSAPLCSEPGCSKPATCHCNDACGFLCDKHRQAVHTSEQMKGHHCVSVEQKREAAEEREKYKQNIMKTRAKELRRSLHVADLEWQSVSAALTQNMSEWTRDSCTPAELSAARDSNLSAISQLERYVAQWRRQVNQSHERALVTHHAVENGMQKLMETVATNRAEIDQLMHLSALQSMMQEKLLSEASELDPIRLKKAEIERQISIWHKQKIVPAAQHFAVDLLRRLNGAELGAEVTDAMKAKLEEWRGKEINLSPNKLLYKADRDGWRAEDILRCVAEVGPTLMLIKAAGSGYIFGAFTAVRWPALPRERPSVMMTIADPSCSSFLFSLTNRYSHPYVLRLVDSTRALRIVAGGYISFGAEDVGDIASGVSESHANLLLFNAGRAANQVEANFCNRIDKGSAYQLDRLQWKGKRGAQAKPSKFNEEAAAMFAGEGRFVAEAIEVFSV